MANSLGINLMGKTVILKDIYPDKKGNDYKRAFVVRGGFGAFHLTSGTALMGEFLRDGESCRVEGYDVDRLATDEEIEKAKVDRIIFDDMAENYGLFRIYMRKEDFAEFEVGELMKYILTSYEPENLEELKNLYDQYQKYRS